MESMIGDGVQASNAHIDRCNADGESDRQATRSVQPRETNTASAGSSPDTVCTHASTTDCAYVETTQKYHTVPPAVLPWLLPDSCNRLITTSLAPGPNDRGDPPRSPPCLRSSDGIAYLPASRLLPPPRRIRPQVEQQFCQVHTTVSPSEDDMVSSEQRAASSRFSSAVDPFSVSTSSMPPTRPGQDLRYSTARAAEYPESVRDAAARTVNAFLLQRARRVQAGRSHRNASTTSGRPQQHLQQVLLQQQPVRRRAGLEEPSTGLAASADILGVVDQLRQVLDRLQGSDTLLERRSTLTSHDTTEETIRLIRPHYPTITQASVRTHQTSSPSSRQARRQRQQQQRQDLQDLRQLIFKIADLTISDPVSWASANASGGSETEENDPQRQVTLPTGTASNTGTTAETDATTAGHTDTRSPSGRSSGGAPDGAGYVGGGGARQPPPVSTQPTAPAPTVTPASAQQNVLLFLGYGGGPLLVRTLMVKETVLASDEPNVVSNVGGFAELKELLIYVKNECMYLLRELAINNVQLAAVCAWNPDLMRLLFEMIESPVTFDSSELLLEELVSSREGLLSARQGCPQWFHDHPSSLPQTLGGSQLSQTSLDHVIGEEARTSVARQSGGAEVQPPSPLSHSVSSASFLRSAQVHQTNFVSRLSMRHVAVMTRLLSLLLFERDDRHACEDTLSLLQIPRADTERRQGRERRRQGKRQKPATEACRNGRKSGAENGSEPENRCFENQRSLLKARGGDQGETKTASGEQPMPEGKRVNSGSRSKSSSPSSSCTSERDDPMWERNSVDDESGTSTEEADEEEPKYPYIFSSHIRPVYAYRDNVGRLLRRAVDCRLRGKSHRVRSSSPSAASREDAAFEGNVNDTREASEERQTLHTSRGSSCSAGGHSIHRSRKRRERVEMRGLTRLGQNDIRDGETRDEEPSDVSEADASAPIRQDADCGRGLETLASRHARSPPRTRGRSRRRKTPASRRWSENPSQRVAPCAFSFDAWRGRWSRRAGTASEPWGTRERGRHNGSPDRAWIKQRFNRPSSLALDRQLYVDVHTQSTHELLRELDDGAGRREARSLRCCPLAATGLFHSASCDVCLVGNQRAILDCPQLLERLVDLLALQVLPLPACVSALTCGNMPGIDSANALVQRLSQSTTPLFEEALGVSSLSSSSSSPSASHAVRSSPDGQRGVAVPGQSFFPPPAVASHPAPHSQNEHAVLQETTRTSAQQAAGSVVTAPFYLGEGVAGGESSAGLSSHIGSFSRSPAASHQPAGTHHTSTSGQASSQASGGSVGSSSSVWRRLSSFVIGNRCPPTEDVAPASDPPVSSSSSASVSASSADRQSSRAENSVSLHRPSNSMGPDLVASHGPPMGQVSATIMLEFTPEGLMMIPGASPSSGVSGDNRASLELPPVTEPEADGPDETPPSGGDSVSPSLTLIPVSSDGERTADEEGLFAIPTFPSSIHRTRTMRVIPEPIQFPRITFPVAAVVEARHRHSQAGLETSPSPEVSSNSQMPLSSSPSTSGLDAETEAELAVTLAAIGGFVWLPRGVGEDEHEEEVLPVTATGHPIVYLPDSFTSAGSAATFSPFVLVLPCPSSETLTPPPSADPGSHASSWLHEEHSPDQALFGAAETSERRPQNHQEDLEGGPPSGASSPLDSQSSETPFSGVNSAAEYLWNLLSLGSNASLSPLSEPNVPPDASQANSTTTLEAANAAASATPSSQDGIPSSFPSSVPTFVGGVANTSGARTVVQVMVQAAVTAMPGSEEFFPTSSLMGAQMPTGHDLQQGAPSFTFSLPFAGAVNGIDSASSSAHQLANSVRPGSTGGAASSNDRLSVVGTRLQNIHTVGQLGTGGSIPVGVSSFDISATGGLSDLLGEGLSTTLWTNEDVEDLSTLQAGGDGGSHQGTQHDLEQLQRIFDQAFDGYRNQRRAVKREERIAREKGRRESRDVEGNPFSVEYPERESESCAPQNNAGRGKDTKRPTAPDASTSAVPEPVLCMGINDHDAFQGMQATNMSDHPSSFSSSSRSSHSSSSRSSSSSSRSSSSSSSLSRRMPRRSWFADARGSLSASRRAQDSEGVERRQDEVASRRSNSPKSPYSPETQREDEPEEQKKIQRRVRIPPTRGRGGAGRPSQEEIIQRPAEPGETEKEAERDTEAHSRDGNVFSRLLRRLSSSFFMSRSSELRGRGDRRESADACSQRIGSGAEASGVRRESAASEAGVEANEKSKSGPEAANGGGEATGSGRSLSPSRAVDEARRGSGDAQMDDERLRADAKETKLTADVHLPRQGPAPQAAGSPGVYSGSVGLPASSSPQPRVHLMDDADRRGAGTERDMQSVSVAAGRCVGEDGVIYSGRSASSGLFPSSSISSASSPLVRKTSAQRSYSTLSAGSPQDTDFNSFSEALPGDAASSLTSQAPGALQNAEWRVAEERGSELARRRGDNSRGREQGRGVGGTGERRMKREGDNEACPQGEKDVKVRASQPESGLTDRERARVRRYILRIERRKRLTETDAAICEQKCETNCDTDACPSLSASPRGNTSHSEADRFQNASGKGNRNVNVSSDLSAACRWVRRRSERDTKGTLLARSLGASDRETSKEDEGGHRDEYLSSDGSTGSDTFLRRERGSRERLMSLSCSSVEDWTSPWSSSSDSSFMSTSTEDEADESIKMFRLVRKASPSDLEFISSLTARPTHDGGRKRSENVSASSSPSNALNFFRVPNRRRPVASKSGTASGCNGGDHLGSRKEKKDHGRSTRKDSEGLANGSSGDKRRLQGTHRDWRRQNTDREMGNGERPESNRRVEGEGRTVPRNLYKRECGSDEGTCSLGVNQADEKVMERSDRDKEATGACGAERCSAEIPDPSPEFTRSIRSASRERISPSFVSSFTSSVGSSSSSSLSSSSSASSSRMLPLSAASSEVDRQREVSTTRDRASASSYLPTRESDALRHRSAPSHHPSPSAFQPPNPSLPSSVSSASSSIPSSRLPAAAPARAAGPAMVLNAVPEGGSVIGFVPRLVGDADADALAALSTGQLGAGGGSMSVDLMLATALSALAQAAARSNNEWLHVLLNGLVQHFASPNRSYVLRIAGLCQHQPEQYFVICGLLAGRFRNEVQQRLNQRQFLPLLSQLFDTIIWLGPVPSRHKQKGTGSKRCSKANDGDSEYANEEKAARDTREKPSGEARRSHRRDTEEKQHDDEGDNENRDGDDPLKLACESSLCGLTVEFLRVIHDVCDFESGTVASVTKRQLLTIHEKNVVMHSFRRTRRVDKARDGRLPCCVRVVKRRAAVVHPHPMMCLSRMAPKREDGKKKQDRSRGNPERDGTSRDLIFQDGPDSETGNSEGDGEPEAPGDLRSSQTRLASHGTLPSTPDTDHQRRTSISSSSVSSSSRSSCRSSSVSSGCSCVSSSSPRNACTSDPAGENGAYGAAGGLGPGGVHQSDKRHPRVMTRYVFKGTTGLLTKLIAVYAGESCASVYKFWLASSIEACIRGADPLLKIFAAERGLLHVLLRDVVKIADHQYRDQARRNRTRMRRYSAKRRQKNLACETDAGEPSVDNEREPGRAQTERNNVENEKARDLDRRQDEDGKHDDMSDDGEPVEMSSYSPFHPSSVHRGILQSCCDLLGELIKFNPHVLHMLNVYLASRPRTLALLLNVLVENLVDSNVFLRSLYLTIEFCRQVRHLHRLLVGAARTALRDVSSPSSPLPLSKLGAEPGLVGPREAALVILPARLLRVMKVTQKKSVQSAFDTEGVCLPPTSGGDGDTFPVSVVTRRSIHLQALEAAMNDPLLGLPLLSPTAPLAVPPRPSILQSRYAFSAYGTSPYSRGPSLAAAAAAAAATLAAGPDADIGLPSAAQRDTFGLQGELSSVPPRVSGTGDTESQVSTTLSQTDMDEALELLKKELLPLWRAVHIFERNASNPYALHAAEDPAGRKSGAASPRSHRGAYNAVAAAARSLADRDGDARGEKRKHAKAERRQGTLLTCDRFGMPHQFNDCCVRGWHAAPSGLSLPFVEGPSLRSVLARSETRMGRHETHPGEVERHTKTGTDQNEFLSRSTSSPFPASVALAEAAAKGEYWEQAPLRDAHSDLRVEVSAAMADNALKKCRELHAVFRTKYAVDIEDVVPDVGSEAEAQRPLFLFARLQRTALIKKLMCVVPFDTVAPDTICCVNSCLLLLLLALLDGELEETLDTVRRDLAEEEDGGCPVLARQARGAWPSPPDSWSSYPSSLSETSSALLFRICRDAGNVPTFLSAAHAGCRRCRQVALERIKEERQERRDARREVKQRDADADIGRAKVREMNGDDYHLSEKPANAFLKARASPVSTVRGSNDHGGQRVRDRSKETREKASPPRYNDETKEDTDQALRNLAAGGDLLHCAARLLRQHEKGTGGLTRDKKQMRGMSLPVHNFWCLLHFWQLHYSRRSTDARGLEFSCQIPLGHWHDLVSILGGKSSERSSLAFREGRSCRKAKARKRKDGDGSAFI